MLTSDADLRRVLQEHHVIAVVGASDSEGKPAHDIPAFLAERGYELVPVNPAREAVLGIPTVADLSEVTRNVDVVQVFRPAEEAPDIARKAVGVGAAVLWLQEGIVSQEAARIAEESGLEVVMDRCMGATYRRLDIGSRDATTD